MKTWFKKEYFIVGIDEAGRGPLAGPLAVAAVVTVISRHVQRGRSDVAGRVFLFQNNRSIHRQIREKKPTLFISPFVLTSSLFLSTITIIFSPGLATSNLFLISPSLPDSLSSLATSAPNSAFLFSSFIISSFISLDLTAPISLFLYTFTVGKISAKKTAPRKISIQPE